MAEGTPRTTPVAEDGDAAESRGYHHGDLRAALITEGLEMTRSDGPSALSLREATRRAGVTPAAAYRHFRDRAALLAALGQEIQERMAERMRARTDDRSGPVTGAPGPVAGTPDPVAGSPTPVELVARAEAALHRLRDVGLGYIDFAIEEPGWFETAFAGQARNEDRAPLEEMPPVRELLAALEECVASGALPAYRRPGAEFSCWSAVHGCAELMVHGPLRGSEPQAVRQVAERVVDDIITGIR